MSAVTIDQSGAVADGDIVAGSKEVHYHAAERKQTVVEALLQKLHAEIEQNQRAQATIDRLQRFHKARDYDGVTGLEAKLHAGGRDAEYQYAIEMKEEFSKLLEAWSLYGSAQQILAFLMARAEHRFSLLILPKLGGQEAHKVDGLIEKHIVEPTVADCGASVFQIDHNVAMGMFYWLAEQCFVRWHP